MMTIYNVKYLPKAKYIPVKIVVFFMELWGWIIKQDHARVSGR